MMKIIRILLPFLAVLAFAGAAFSQEGQLSTAQPNGITVQQIIEKFATKEKEFKEARDLYTFRQDVRVQTLDGDTVTGEYREVFDVTYDNQGRHLENVKTSGKTVPDIRKKNNENLFPKFTTWREQVDGKYWFPAYTKADDTLHFRQALQDVHIRETIKYTDYKRFGSKVTVTYQGKE